MENIFANIPKELAAEVVENIVQNNAVNIERIISKGHISPESGWYEEQQNEWVILLKGQAMILFENQTTVYLKPGDYTHVTSRCFVRRKLGDQSKTQHEVMVIPFSIGATQRWFSS